VVVHPDLLIYLAVVGALWIAYVIRKFRRARSKPRLGDADAYDGNLEVPMAGLHHGRVTGHKSHGGVYTVHSDDAFLHGGGHAGHGPAGGGHH
jgi:hypothetical protein